jgi:DNA-directed RNA polymerase specialized sigma24 family protein
MLTDADLLQGDARRFATFYRRHEDAVLGRSLERRRVENDARQRLGMQPLVLDDEAIARIVELSDEPALRALDALPEHQSLAVRGHVLEESGYAELAQQLECSESVVRQRVSRGLRALRAELRRDDGSTA